MNVPEFDRRGAGELMAELMRLAAWYTPEWRPDPEEPDAGMALARLFAQWMQDSLRYGDARLQNHFLAFLNLTGGGRRAPISARGLAQVRVRDGGAGAAVPAGTVLYAPADNSEGRVYFETEAPLFAVSNGVEALFLTDREADCIQRLDLPGDGAALRLFDLARGENLQRRALYIANDPVFYAETRSELVLTFENRSSGGGGDRLADRLLDGVCWQYWDGAGWAEVADAQRYGGGVRLRFPGGAQPCRVHGETARFLRAGFPAAPEGPILLDGVTCAAQGTGLAPDVLLREGESLLETDALPFGETPTLFDAFYLSARQVFGKRGARVELALELSFRRVRPQGLPEPPPIQYKRLMRKDGLEPPPPLELEVERVVWEYWNGLGWKRLEAGEEGETVFAAAGAPGVRRWSFVCPGDWQPSEQGPEEGLFLRARPVRVGRPAALGDVYLAPVIRRVELGYRYPGGGLPCELLLEESDLGWRRPALPAPQPVPLLGQTLCPRPALYLRLREPLRTGPVRVLVELAEQVGAARPPLRWEYFGADTRGRGCWKSLPVEDGTGHLSHTGVVTIQGREDFLSANLFGEEGYFLRLVDETGGYAPACRPVPPSVRGITWNATAVVQRDGRRPEVFWVENWAQSKVCRLPAGGLCRLEVWVDEWSARSAGERERLLLRAGDDVRPERDGAGRLQKLWVRWRETRRLDLCDGGARVYEADACTGVVRFGDGVHGAAPPAGETVRVEYSVSAGAEGNLDAHALAGLARPVPGAAGVDNPRSFSGGAGPEDTEDAALRLNGWRNCSGRAVTPGDLEEMLCRADPHIRRVRCAPHVDRLGRAAEGALSVAILPRGFRGDPAAFAALEQRARALLAPRLSAGLTGLTLFETDYLELSVTAELSVGSGCALEAAEAALRRYLEPEGWDIGTLPGRSELRRFLEGLDGVVRVERLELFARAVTERGPEEVDPERPPRSLFTVPVCGRLELTATEEGGMRFAAPGAISRRDP